jgi:hypothetical protein
MDEAMYASNCLSSWLRASRVFASTAQKALQSRLAASFVDCAPDEEDRKTHGHMLGGIAHLALALQVLESIVDHHTIFGAKWAYLGFGEPRFPARDQGDRHPPIFRNVDDIRVITPDVVRHKHIGELLGVGRIQAGVDCDAI